MTGAAPFVTGCANGTNGSRLPLATAPFGATVRVALADVQLRGELLTLDEVTANATVAREAKRRLQLVSRFPYGLPADQLAVLLASLGQTAPAGVMP